VVADVNKDRREHKSVLLASWHGGAGAHIFKDGVCPGGGCGGRGPRVHVMRHCALGLNAAFGECGTNCGS